MDGFYGNRSFLLACALHTGSGVFMSTIREVSNKQCPICGDNIVRISMKTPLIDDYEEGCINDKCPKYKNLVWILEQLARTWSR